MRRLRRRWPPWCVGMLAAMMVATGCSGGSPPVPSAAPSGAVTETPLPTSMPDPLPTYGPSETPTDIVAPSVTPTPTVSPRVTPTPTPQPKPRAPKPPPPKPPAPAPATLDRAVWVHLFDGSLKTREGIARVVERLDGARATAIVAEVVRRHDAYYDSDVLPRTSDPAFEPGLDVLATLISEAHAAGLEVHAWIPVAPTWHAAYDGLAAPADWLPAEHGLAAPERDRWVTRTVDGAWTEYLDPALPEVRAHVAAVVREIAEDYDVDGIHLDYVRYASQRHGYHPRALARYREATGTTATPPPDDAAWSRWRRAQVDALVADAGRAIDAAGSDAVLSAAVIAWGDGPGGSVVRDFEDTAAFREALQDWEGWAERDLVDVLMPMDYFREADAQQSAWLRRWLDYQAGLERRTGTPVVPGIAGYLNSPRDALTQVGLADARLGSVAVYSYQGSTNDPERPLWASLAASDWGG